MLALVLPALLVAALLCRRHWQDLLLVLVVARLPLVSPDSLAVLPLLPGVEPLPRVSLADSPPASLLRVADSLPKASLPVLLAAVLLASTLRLGGNT